MGKYVGQRQAGIERQLHLENFVSLRIGQMRDLQGESSGSSEQRSAGAMREMASTEADLDR